jgi:hypothetical protein
MSNVKPKRALATYAIVVWMVINVVFMALELTVFNDAADPNNAILLILLGDLDHKFTVYKKIRCINCSFCVDLCFLL